MQPLLQQFDGVEITTQIRRVRYSRIRVRSSKQVIVIGRNQQSINEILKEKQEWVAEKLQEMKRMEEAAAFEAGKLHFFGAQLDVSQLDGLSDAELSGRFRSALLSHAEKSVADSTLIPPKIEIRRMRSRLGVYAIQDDAIRLSVYLAFLPKELIDYVIFHELTHRDVRHHKARFWQKIAEKYPDYRQKEKELDVWWLRAKNLLSSYERLRRI